MEKKHIVDKRQVKLEEILKEGFIPFLSGRPDRNIEINHEDIIDLKIALNTTMSVEMFLTVL